MATEMELMAYLYWQRAMALQKDNQEELILNNHRSKSFLKFIYINGQ